MDLNEKFLARTDAVEAKVFYDNKLAKPEYQKTYFPQTQGETSSQYLRRPKISIPISSSIINRIVNILNFKTVVSATDKEHQKVIDYISPKIKLHEVFRDIIVNTLVTGNNVTVIKPSGTIPKIEHWDGRYVDIVDNNYFGYQYLLKDGLVYPVLDNKSKKDEVYTTLFDDKLWGDFEHNMGFNPAVLTKNIDKYESGIYGKSYVERFSDMVVEYNQIVSQIAKSIKILQNVWKSNRSVDNPEKPIRLNPDTINFLGPDGVLEQVVRELNLNEEKDFLNLLEHQISRASQVPAELSGLQNIGKLPSGIALQLYLQPLSELLSRLRELFIPAFTELMEKIVFSQYIIEGKPIPKNLEITISMNEDIFPEDRKSRIDEVILLKKEGIITDDEARLMIEPYLNLQV